MLLAFSLGTVGFGPPVLTDSHYPPLRLAPDQVQATYQLAQPPAVGAASALMVDLDSEQTLYALQPREALPPASTAKIMTALLALERGKLDDLVTVSAKAAGTNGSRMGLVPGETLTVRDLLYGLLLPSGNDAAEALAEYVGGSETKFVALMNETAAALGLAETHFTNPHGLDSPTETVSAADLAVIVRAALAYPVFTQIVSTKSAQIAGHLLINTNHLLYSYPGADGVKTGTTPAAGECLIASVTRAGHRLLVILLGSQDRYADAVTLLNYATANWRWQPVTLPDDALAWEIGPDGHSYRLRAAASREIFLPTWQWALVQPVRVLDASVPLTGTLPVGSLQLTLGGQVLARAPLTVWQGP